MEKNTSEKDNENLSVCDVMKSDTSEIIKKLESQMPTMFQNYSDLYRAYLHLYDDIFGTCYIAEKEFFDKLNIDQNVLKQIKSTSESFRNYQIKNIEMTSKLFDEYIKMRLSGIESFDRYVHTLMDGYTKTLSQFNKQSEKLSK